MLTTWFCDDEWELLFSCDKFSLIYYVLRWFWVLWLIYSLPKDVRRHCSRICHRWGVQQSVMPGWIAMGAFECGVVRFLLLLRFSSYHRRWAARSWGNVAISNRRWTNVVGFLFLAASLNVLFLYRWNSNRHKFLWCFEKITLILWMRSPDN